MNPYIHSLSQLIAGRPVMVRPGFVSEGFTISKKDKEVVSWGNFAAELKALASVNVVEHIARTQIRNDELCKAYGFGGGSLQSKPFAFADGTAIIPIYGTLMPRLPYSFSFATGYNFIQSQLAAAMGDPDVKQIVYDVNSNGGTVAGCQECSDAIFAANKSNGGKPSVASIDTNCYSAAYYLASGADAISITPSGGAGSIGVVMMHADVSKALAEFGVDITFIHAGAHKVDGNMFQPLSAEVTSDIQAVIDKMYGNFTASVGRGRGSRMTVEQAVNTEARCYLADEALTLGLVDAVQSPLDALNSLDAFTNEDVIVATENNNTHTAEQVSAAANEARQAERARISGIMGHAEAKDRTTLATHLANNTDMTVEGAASVLAASAKETPKAPAAAAEEPNHFKSAMDNGKHPNAGEGKDGKGNGTEAATPANRILAAQAKATGDLRGIAKK